MKKFFHAHPQVIIVTLALVFVGVIIGGYIWAVGDIYTEVDQALVAPVPQSVQSFDLAGAAAIDLRGIPTSTPVSASVPPADSVPSASSATP